MVKNLDAFIEHLFEGFSPKQRKVVTSRFGLRTGHRAPLQEIGDELGITRERVRQIEEQSLKKLRSRIREEAGDFLEVVAKYLDTMGGIRRDETFLMEVRKKFPGFEKVKHADQKLRFLFLAAETPFHHKDTDDVYSFWYTSDISKKRLFDFLKQMLQVFRTANKQEFLEKRAYLAYAKDFASSNFLSVSKHIGVNMFGDMGLRVWPEIEPKTIRDKAYLVLRKHGKPLHFEDVAKYIARYGIDREAAHVQTVHNELIKDPRFVLVGRGLYALREHGYEPGTVREVIARLLKKEGPMGADEVVKEVNKQRILKQNTILLSLQNRKYFKRLDDGRYHVREA